MENPSLAGNLVYQRKLKGYTQEELSEKTKVTVRTIQRIEKGEVNPHLQTVKLLASALEIEVDDLIILENPKQESIQKKWLLLLHGTPVLGMVLPLCNILFPLFLWIHKREDNRVYDIHGRAIVNFQITMTILFFLSFIALITVEKWGFFLFMAIIPYAVIVMVINILFAVRDQKCYYPLSLPFLKSGKKKAANGAAIIAMFFLFSTGGCKTGTPDHTDITRLDGSVISGDSLTSKIKRLMEDAGVHGMSVTIFNDNRKHYQKTFGYRDYSRKLPLHDTTNMYGASLSKAVFSILVMKLVEEQVIALDTPLESCLPKKIFQYEPRTSWHDDFSDLQTDTLYAGITARMCLAHTTGFPNWRWFEEDKKLRVHFEPGTRYSYSGEGFVYLQVVLEKLLGKSLEELAREKIFTPLKMKRSSYKWLPSFEKEFAFGHSPSGKPYKKDKDNEPRGGSTLETTPEDYTKFMEAVLQNKIISRASRDKIFTPRIRIRSVRQFGPLSQKDSTLNDDISLSYGLGWGLLQSPYGTGAFKEGHGDGFQHYSIIFPKTGQGILMMTNSDNGESIFKELLEVALADTYTPWEWENYIPYNQK